MTEVFNIDVLKTVKEAGIPVATVVGIASIFTMIFSLIVPGAWRGKNKDDAARQDGRGATEQVVAGAERRTNFRLIYSMGLIVIACFTAFFWFSTREIHQWVYTGEANWNYGDIDWTEGARPYANLCTGREEEGNFAVCWQVGGNPSPDSKPQITKSVGQDRNAQVWCTYKDKAQLANLVAVKTNLGRAYVCARVSM